MQLQKGNPPDVPHSRADAVTSNKLLVKDAGGDVISRGTQVAGRNGQEFKHPSPPRKPRFGRFDVQPLPVIHTAI